MTPHDNIDKVEGRHHNARWYASHKKLPYINVCKACEDDGKCIGRNKGINGADSHERTETHVLAVASFQHVRKEDRAKEGARRNRGATQRAYDNPHNDCQDRESAPEFAKPFIKHIHGIKPKARMEYQFTHQDEKGYGEQSESRNRSENSCYYRNQARYSPQEEIGGNHIDNKKGKGNGQVGEKQEDHATKEQANDQPPFHRLPSSPNLDKSAPRHPEELDGKEDTAYGDDDENSPFRNSNRPYIGHPF